MLSAVSINTTSSFEEFACFIALGREIKRKKNWEKTMHLGTAFKTDEEEEGRKNTAAG